MFITFILGEFVYTTMTCDAETPIILYLYYVYNTMSLSDCGLNIILIKYWNYCTAYTLQSVK